MALMWVSLYTLELENMDWKVIFEVSVAKHENLQFYFISHPWVLPIIKPQ
jgi:hypothetical protein